MKLNLNGIKDAAKWNAANIRTPNFDIDLMRMQTKKTPEWIHFGAGNIFRGFIGSIAQKLLNDGEMDTGIIACESFDFDIIDKIYLPYDNLTLNVMMDKNSDLDMEVLAGIAEGIKASDFEYLKTLAQNPSLKIISFTITEKGYAVTDANDNLIGIARADIENGLQSPVHTMSIIAAMLHARYVSCGSPLAVVSMDNCSHNGEKLQAGVKRIIDGWLERGFVDSGFAAYVSEKISFPWSMIDKITPRPDDTIKKRLTALGLEDIGAVVTDKNTYIAPFVNAEIPQYLVIEDNFPNGRPPLEKAGVYLTTRETVNKAETMKVTTCLNPLHTALAVFGCLLGYKTIWEEMKDTDLVRLVRKIRDEGMKVVVDPGIINPTEFADEVINDRLPNPYIPDAPQRIATDTSQKIPVRYGETIKSYEKIPNLSAADLEAIPLVIAGWLRYLLAKDDNGNVFTPSPDPMLGEMQTALADIEVGKSNFDRNILKPILSNKNLFGVDLYEAGIGEKVESKFVSMLQGKGAVRLALKNI